MFIYTCIKIFNIERTNIYVYVKILILRGEGLYMIVLKF